MLLYYWEEAQVKDASICKIILALGFCHTIDELRKFAGPEFFTELQTLVRRLKQMGKQTNLKYSSRMVVAVTAPDPACNIFHIRNSGRNEEKPGSGSTCFHAGNYDFQSASS